MVVFFCFYTHTPFVVLFCLKHALVFIRKIIKFCKSMDSSIKQNKSSMPQITLEFYNIRTFGYFFSLLLIIIRIV